MDGYDKVQNGGSVWVTRKGYRVGEGYPGDITVSDFFLKNCIRNNYRSISKHNRGGQSVLFGSGGRERKRERARRTTQHGLGPRAEASVGT